MLLPLLVLFSPESLSLAAKVDGPTAQPVGPSILAATPVGSGAAAPWRTPAPASRVAWTVDVGGHALTFAPVKPAGEGLLMNVELSF